MRAIVTGATGMIGQHLIKYLVSQNVEVLAFVNPNSTRKKDLFSHELVEVVEQSLEDMISYSFDKQYDYFFHLGWKGTHGNSRNDLYLQEENVRDALTMVDVANHAKCSVFVGAGSQAEYGRPYNRENEIIKEKLSQDTIAKPETGYGIGKYMAGILTKKRCEQLNIRHEWVRILSIYGPGDGKHTMVMSGIYDMLDGKVAKYTKGEQEWDYLYVKDAVKAIYLVAQKGKGRTYCLGSGKTRLLKDYILDIRDAVNKDLEVQIGVLPYMEGQVMYLCADIKALQDDVGFYPETEFIDGIRETVDWVKMEKRANEKN